MFATPTAALYSATKAYVDMFSQALALEYKQDGVTVQCLIPAQINSKMINGNKSKASKMVPNPDTYVKSALATLGTEARTTGYWAHQWFLYFMMNWLPEWAYEKFLKVFYSYLSYLEP